jgi:hypothetical protein
MITLKELRFLCVKQLAYILLLRRDVYNNPITTEIQFVVVGDESITLTHVLNYPNPFVNYTEFTHT